MTIRGPISEKLVELLADGNWHDLDLVLNELGKMVTPGTAMREMERSRRNNARTEEAATGGRMYEIDEHRLIRSGQRRLALSAVHRATHNGWIEVDPPATGGRRKVPNRRIRMVKAPAWAERIGLVGNG